MYYTSVATGDQNMNGREAAIRYLTEHMKALTEKRDQCIQATEDLEDEIDNIEETLRSIGKADTAVPEKEESFPIAKLRKLTQVQALVVIAKHYGGTFKAQEAKRLLIKAGVMRETKNSTNIIHAVILRSEKFDRVRPGEYKLKEPMASITPTPVQQELARIEAAFSKPVQ